MFGSIDEPQFRLDSDERKNDIKENIVIEKETVKSILKTEFGLFQKDSTVRKMAVDNKKEVEFIYYDEDVELEEKDTTTKKDKNKKRSNKFFEKLENDSKKAKENVQFEQDLGE
jgi:hypothetical protein